ncbi:MAG: VacJ family lipoprotein [Deltaproteobacteria bacterium]|nr:VacJ family lipoprotein [Deltaproteobacteria bacterium]
MVQSLQRRTSTAARAAAICLVLSWSLACASTPPDPYQGFNKSIFRFNEGLDRMVLEPVAKGWDWALPGFAKTGVGNFFDNLRMLRTMLNDLLQGKPTRSGIDVGRFAVNTTIGIVGLFDPATPMGIPHYEEDFGQTLGVWGLGPGPYFQVPFFGPYSGRDLAAFPVDFVTVPSAYGITVIDIINTRATYLEEIAENRESALDYYVFVRNAYLQNRQRRVMDGEEAAEDDDDDFYDLDELDDDELDAGEEDTDTGASLD